MPDATSYSIFIPFCVASDHSRILQLLSVTCGRDADDSTSDYTANASADGTGDSGYLVLVRAGRFEDAAGGDDDWHGRKVKIDLTGDTAIAVSHMEVMFHIQVVFHIQVMFGGNVSHAGNVWR